ncbi:MAG: hypothetical protein K940chlam7_01912, partial [Chlamydiae bacterium]|nr:hypothetical protein [Chlamydiota bacterium]
RGNHPLVVASKTSLGISLAGVEKREEGARKEFIEAWKLSKDFKGKKLKFTAICNYNIGVSFLNSDRPDFAMRYLIKGFSIACKKDSARLERYLDSLIAAIATFKKPEIQEEKAKEVLTLCRKKLGKEHELTKKFKKSKGKTPPPIKFMPISNIYRVL